MYSDIERHHLLRKAASLALTLGLLAASAAVAQNAATNNATPVPSVQNTAPAVPAGQTSATNNAPPSVPAGHSPAANNAPSAVVAQNNTAPSPAPAPESASAQGPQNVSPQESAAAAVGEEITVTATRVNRADYSSPTPTVVVGAAQLDQYATTNVADYLDTMPMFKGDQSSTATAPNARSAGADYLDLRGLGESRTLVLVDGLRFVPEADAGISDYNVDVNSIPSLMVDHIETVTGGASAQWGSDAVAGVVNIILKKNFEGFEATAQGGLSTYGDDGDMRYGFIAGKNFMDNRLNVTFSVDYERNYGIGDSATRPWGRNEGYLITNPCPASAKVSSTCPSGSNGLATDLIEPNVQFSNQAPGGLITNTALRGTTFGPGGQILPFNYGQLVGGTYQVGGGQPGINYTNQLQLQDPFQREVAYGKVTYEVSDNVSAYVEFNYALSDTGGTGIPYMGSATITSNNAFLPAALKTDMQQDKISSFTLATNEDTPQFTPTADLTNQVMRGVTGLSGHFGDHGNWKWSADAGFGENIYNLSVPGSAIIGNYAFAANAIVNPANGQITCAALVPGNKAYNPKAAAGCVPMNLFGGPGSSIPASGYVNGDIRTVIDYKQTFVSTSLSGEPFHSWAGPVSVATGFDYRNESESAWADPIANEAGYSGNNSSTFSGSFDVAEVFGETVVPLLKDSILGKSMDLNAAVRYEDYSGSSGSQLPWKVGITYRPVESLMLRAARSLDIRAPNIFERDDPSTSRNGAVTYGSGSPNVMVVSSGNPNLVPEKANTTTYGFAFTPDFAPGLAFSVDHWDIDIKNVISTLEAQNVSSACQAGQETYCKMITFNSAGVPTQIDTPFLNLSLVNISGIDTQLSYRLPLSDISNDLNGALTFAMTGTYTQHAFVNSGAIGALTIDRAGENGPINEFATPRFVSTTSITYTNDPLTASIRARQVSAGNYDNTFNNPTYSTTTINDNRIGGAVYIDLTGSYSVSPRLTFFAVINNLLNRAPPVDPTANATSTNTAYYDVIGTTVMVGVRFKH